MNLEKRVFDKTKSIYQQSKKIDWSETLASDLFVQNVMCDVLDLLDPGGTARTKMRSLYLKQNKLRDSASIVEWEAAQDDSTQYLKEAIVTAKARPEIAALEQ